MIDRVEIILRTSASANAAGIGCSVSPVLTVEGLDITGTVPGVSSVFGQIVPINGYGTQPSGWPMPGGGASSWPSNLYSRSPWNTWTDYAWQTPVNQVNVAFQGTPVADTTALSCTQPTSTSSASCTIPKSGWRAERSVVLPPRKGPSVRVPYAPDARRHAGDSPRAPEPSAPVPSPDFLLPRPGG